MKKIGKLTKEDLHGHGFSLSHEKGYYIASGMTENRADQVLTACRLLDSLIPGADLKRSGHTIEVGECRPNDWFWLDGENGSWWMMLHRCGNGTVFIRIASHGGIMSRAPKNVELVELPTKQ